MRYAGIIVFAVITLFGWGFLPADQEPPAIPGAAGASQAGKSPSPEEIIRRFTAKETESYAAWMQYSYTQIAVIKVVSLNGAPRNESMTIVSEVVFNDDGTREVRPLRRSGRLRSVRLTPEDEDVMLNINPFALTESELPLYNLKYEGKEKVDELVCYVFSVRPKNTRGDRFYFKGKIYVDDRDLQIVKTVGRPVPERRGNLFPEFETLRLVIDGEYWFPVWTHADEKLHFAQDTVGIEQTLTYENYKRFGSKATIRFGAPEVETGE